MQAAILGVRVKFAGVSHVSTEELAAAISSQEEGSEGSGQKKQVLLLDVREPEEFEISHLPNAVNVDYRDTAAATAIVQEAKPDRVVCYCSVGYRSSTLAQALSTASAAVPVENLEGSIFKWANERRPMVDGEGRATVFVHPFSAVWGRLLPREMRKWHP